MFLQIVFILLCELNQQFVTTGRLGPPVRAPWVGWVKDIINVHYTNMTGEILKDIQLKLEQSKLIQNSYKYSMSYELGTLAASIQEIFKFMLKVYRYYADLPRFTSRVETFHRYLQGYQLVQGGYNKIRNEKKLYFEVLDKHKAAREKTEEIRKKHTEFDNRQNASPQKGLRRFGGTQVVNEKLRMDLDGEETGVQITKEVELVVKKPPRKIFVDLPPQRMKQSSSKKLWSHRVEQFGGASRNYSFT